MRHNCCYSPTFNFDVKTKSSAKSNNYMCTSTKTNASHTLLSKRPFRASKYSLNNRGLKRQPYFTPYWDMKLEVTPSLRWLMCTISLTYIACRHRKKLPFTLRPANTCHNISQNTIPNAFLKSTKQQYSGFFFSLVYFIRVHNMKSWSIMR